MKMMRFLMMIVFTVAACDKPVVSDTEFRDLSFVQTNTPTNVMVNQNILSSVTVAGMDLCYHFAYFTINPQITTYQLQTLIDIHAKGTYPIKPTVCLQAFYYKDTTISINASTVGKYVLRFYNGDVLFKSDTVQVN